MEIAVLLKQVPATESMIEISDDGTAIKTEGINWVMNPYDEMAVEEALQIRADAGGTVTVFSLGPERQRRCFAPPWPWAPIPLSASTLKESPWMVWPPPRCWPES